MTTYRVSLNTHLNVVVTIDASNEDDAADKAWTNAEEFAQTIMGSRSLGVVAEATFDGIGADDVEPVDA